MSALSAQPRPRRSAATLWQASWQLLQIWRKEELRLPRRSRWLSPEVGLAALLLISGVAGIDALLRHRAHQREHRMRLQEATGILTATLAGVERSALDWAHWTDMYAWIAGRNPTFVKTDLETTPLFDEGGLFLIYNPDASRRLSYGQKGYNHSSYLALYACAQHHLHRLPQVLARLTLLCRAGDGLLYLGVATPISDSNETAPALGALVMFEPLLKAHYGPSFNRPLQWISSNLRRIDAGGGTPPRRMAAAGPAAGVASVAPEVVNGDATEDVGLSRPIYTEQGDRLVLRPEPVLPQILAGVGRDLLLLLAGLAGLLAVRMLLLSDRRRQRVSQRRSEQASNRRIRHASHDLDRLLERLGPGGSSLPGDDRVLARLIDAPRGETGPAGDASAIERKLERLADRFQYFLERAKHLALLDPLTQLPNRRYFIEQVQLLLENRRLQEDAFAVLFVDIDKFKNINDSYGHGIGDAALKLVADQLRALTRPGDFLGRYGGDEFAILMQLQRPQPEGKAGTGNQSEREAEDESAREKKIRELLLNYAQRIVAPFEQAMDLGGFQVELSISVGISVIDAIEPDLAGAMRRSDIAMYRAKQNSHHRIAIFNKSDDDSHLDTYQLYVELMQAIRERNFKVLFQPILDQHGKLHAVEALTRWLHPRLGTIGPEVFVDLAERYRQMTPLSDELIALSMAAFQEVAGDRPDLRLSLNLPPCKLSDPQLVAQLLSQLAQHGIAPSRITIELTERSVLMPNALVSANLRQLRESGMAIALDDFGTGYSSLSLLSTLQPDEVKIDKSFVMAMDHDDYARQIVTLIAEMAPRMNLLVVAEGVEDEAALTLLRSLGIRYFQGFHFSRPLAVEALRGSALLHPPGPGPAAAEA